MNHESSMISLEIAYATVNVPLRLYGAFCLEHGLLTDETFRKLAFSIMTATPNYGPCHQALILGHEMYRGNN